MQNSVILSRAELPNLKNEALKLLKRTRFGKRIVESIKNIDIKYADLVIDDDVSGISNGKVILNPEVTSPAFLATVMAFESVELENPPSLDTIYRAYKRATCIWKELQANGVDKSKLNLFELSKITELESFDGMNKKDLINKLAKKYGEVDLS